MHACMYVCMHAWMYVGMSVCMYVCRYVGMYVCIVCIMYLQLSIRTIFHRHVWQLHLLLNLATQMLELIQDF